MLADAASMVCSRSRLNKLTVPRKSIAINANTPFSVWDEVFPDKAMTVTAVDQTGLPLDHSGDERGQLPTPHRVAHSPATQHNPRTMINAQPHRSR